MSDWPPPTRPDDPPPVSPAYGPPSGAPALVRRRVLAILLDGLILSVPYSIINVGLGVKTIEVDQVTNQFTVHPGAVVLMTLISLVVSCVYSGILEGGPHGASVGKMALRIRVGDAETGEPIGFARAARRRWHERAHIGDLEAMAARSRLGEASALTDPAGLGAFRVLEWEVREPGARRAASVL